MLVLHPPVPGPIVRPFVYAGSPFARGLHRGVDLRAAPSMVVRAPCAGPVAWAGRGGITLRCGAMRVTLLSVRPAVRSGDRVQPGVAVGRLAGRNGLHLGVRHAGDPFGYVDPAPLLRRARRPSTAPPLTAPRGRAAPASRSLSRAAPVSRAAAPQPAAAVARGAPVAPPLAWIGVALLAVGAAGRARLRLAARARRQAASLAPRR